MVDKTFIQPQSAGFSNAVRYTHNGLTTITVSGQVGLEQDGSVSPDLYQQATVALASIKAILKEAGATLADVVKSNVYIVDIDQGKIGKVGKAVHTAFKHLNRKQRAASTWVGVTGLVDKRLGVEIEMAAVIVDGKSRL